MRIMAIMIDMGKNQVDNHNAAIYDDGMMMALFIFPDHPRPLRLGPSVQRVGRHDDEDDGGRREGDDHHHHHQIEHNTYHHYHPHHQHQIDRHNHHHHIDHHTHYHHHIIKLIIM